MRRSDSIDVKMLESKLSRLESNLKKWESKDEDEKFGFGSFEALGTKISELVIDSKADLSPFQTRLKEIEQRINKARNELLEAKLPENNERKNDRLSTSLTNPIATICSINTVLQLLALMDIDKAAKTCIRKGKDPRKFKPLIEIITRIKNKHRVDKWLVALLMTSIDEYWSHLQDVTIVYGKIMDKLFQGCDTPMTVSRIFDTRTNSLMITTPVNTGGLNVKELIMEANTNGLLNEIDQDTFKYLVLNVVPWELESEVRQKPLGPPNIKFKLKLPVPDVTVSNLGQFKFVAAAQFIKGRTDHYVAIVKTDSGYEKLDDAMKSKYPDEFILTPTMLVFKYKKQDESGSSVKSETIRLNSHSKNNEYTRLGTPLNATREALFAPPSAVKTPNTPQSNITNQVVEEDSSGSEFDSEVKKNNPRTSMNLYASQKTVEDELNQFKQRLLAWVEADDKAKLSDSSFELLGTTTDVIIKKYIDETKTSVYEAEDDLEEIFEDAKDVQNAARKYFLKWFSRSMLFKSTEIVGQKETGLPKTTLNISHFTSVLHVLHATNFLSDFESTSTKAYPRYLRFILQLMKDKKKVDKWFIARLLIKLKMPMKEWNKPSTVFYPITLNKQWSPFSTKNWIAIELNVFAMFPEILNRKHKSDEEDEGEGELKIPFIYKKIKPFKSSDIAALIKQKWDVSNSPQVPIYLAVDVPITTKTDKAFYLRQMVIQQPFEKLALSDSLSLELFAAIIHDPDDPFRFISVTKTPSGYMQQQDNISTQFTLNEIKNPNLLVYRVYQNSSAMEDVDAPPSPSGSVATQPLSPGTVRRIGPPAPSKSSQESSELELRDDDDAPPFQQPLTPVLRVATPEPQTTPVRRSSRASRSSLLSSGRRSIFTNELSQNSILKSSRSSATYDDYPKPFTSSSASSRSERSKKTPPASQSPFKPITSPRDPVISLSQRSFEQAMALQGYDDIQLAQNSEDIEEAVDQIINRMSSSEKAAAMSALETDQESKSNERKIEQFNREPLPVIDESDSDSDLAVCVYRGEEQRQPPPAVKRPASTTPEQSKALKRNRLDDVKEVVNVTEEEVEKKSLRFDTAPPEFSKHARKWLHPSLNPVTYITLVNQEKKPLRFFEAVSLPIVLTNGYIQYNLIHEHVLWFQSNTSKVFQCYYCNFDSGYAPFLVAEYKIEYAGDSLHWDIVEADELLEPNSVYANSEHRLYTYLNTRMDDDPEREKIITNILNFMAGSADHSLPGLRRYIDGLYSFRWGGSVMKAAMLVKEKVEANHLLTPESRCIAAFAKYTMQKDLENVYGALSTKTSWVTDTTVYRMSEMFSTMRGVAVSEQFNGSMVTIQNNNQGVDGIIDKIVQTIKKKSNIQLLVMPSILNGHHKLWLLTYEEIMLYDPLASIPTPYESESRVVKAIQRKVFFSTERSITMIGQSNKQRDDYNCGVFVLQAMYYIGMELRAPGTEMSLSPRFLDQTFNQWRDQMKDPYKVRLNLVELVRRVPAVVVAMPK